MLITCITVLKYSLNIYFVARKVKNMRRNVFGVIQVVFENHEISCSEFSLMTAVLIIINIDL